MARPQGWHISVIEVCFNHFHISVVSHNSHLNKLWRHDITWRVVWGQKGQNLCFPLSRPPNPVADPGGAGDAPPPPGSQIFFIFMQFSAKIDKIIGWRPPGSWRPLLGEILDPPLNRLDNQQKPLSSLFQFFGFALEWTELRFDSRVLKEITLVTFVHGLVAVKYLHSKQNAYPMCLKSSLINLVWKGEKEKPAIVLLQWFQLTNTRDVYLVECFNAAISCEPRWDTITTLLFVHPGSLTKSTIYWLRQSLPSVRNFMI